jgi:hypothetical protein
MKKDSKRKLLFMTLLLMLLLFSGAYASLVPNVNAAEIAVQEKGLAILNEVIGLDMENYNTASSEGPKDSYLGVVPQENIRFTLESNGSSIDALYTFANGKLRMLNVLKNEGSPRLTKSATNPVQIGNKTVQVIDVPETAKVFLEDYQGYSGNSFYGDLASMLDDVDANENLTKTIGNVKLEVTVSEGSTVFRWTYTFGGIDAPDKCVAIGYKDDFLKYFIDNWDLYKIGSTRVNISEEEAISIAMERASALSWKVESDSKIYEVKKYNVTNAMIWETLFCSNLYADKRRSDDPLMLYPVRHVWVSLDKFYPGNVYGFNVYVWADTGEVCAIHERISTMDPPDDLVATTDEFTVESSSDQVSVEAKSYSMWLTVIALPAFAAVMLGTVPVWFLLSKKKNLPKRGVFKVGGVLLCLLTASMLLVPVLAVNAKPTRRALIWGSESAGAIDERVPGSFDHWRKTENEVDRQNVTSNALGNYFKDDGYDTDNYKGAGSIATQIVANITDAEVNYSRVAVVDFDHGVGNYWDFPGYENEFHFMFEDNIGTRVGNYTDFVVDKENAVYDMNVSDRTTGKTFFAFINTCYSANLTHPATGDPWQGEVDGRARGMPYAWTHRSVVDKDTPGFTTSLNMSIDGYNEPDGGSFCYIGFPYGSAALSQTITGVSPLYATWLENFFWYALSFDISVNDALDEASLRNFDELFGDTDLATNFGAVWPMWNNVTGWEDPPYSGSTLVVYGNGNIHLYQYFVHEVLDWGTYYYGFVYYPDNLEGGSNDGQYATLEAYWEGSQAAIVSDTARDTAHGNIYLYGDTDGYYSHVLVYVSDDYSNWDCTFDDYVYASSPTWISVGSWSSNFRFIAIVVYNQWWGEDYSVLNVDSVLVIPSPPQSEHYWVYEATEYEYANGHVYNVENVVGSYYDFNTAHIGCPNPPDRADIIGTLDEEVVGGGHVEIYGCSSPGGYYSDMYVYVSSNNQDWYQVGSMLTITATSPYWIDVGTYGSSFRYVRIVGYDSHNSVALNLDCVRVT